MCTPHLGASTREAQSRVADEISLQFVELAAGRPAHGIVCKYDTYQISICIILVVANFLRNGV